MNLIRDLAYGLRQLARRPFFSIAIVLTLAIGIGPNVAIFSRAQGHRHRAAPLPRAPSRLVHVWETDIDGRWRQPFTYPDFRDVREQKRVLRGLRRRLTPRHYNLGTEEPERVQGMMRSPPTPSASGASRRPTAVSSPRVRSRTEARVAVIADSLWKRVFGGDPAIVGESVPIDSVFYQIVGVMAPRLRILHTLDRSGRQVEVWAPLQAPDWRREQGQPLACSPSPG